MRAWQGRIAARSVQSWLQEVQGTSDGYCCCSCGATTAAHGERMQPAAVGVRKHVSMAAGPQGASMCHTCPASAGQAVLGTACPAG